jgi:hypothetical protein
MNWKECRRKWSLPNLRYYSDICLEKLRKTTKKTFVRTDSLQAKILIWDLTNTKQEKGDWY